MKFKVIAKRAVIETVDQYRVVVEMELTREQLKDALFRTFADNDWIWSWVDKTRNKLEVF